MSVDKTEELINAILNENELDIKKINKNSMEIKEYFYTKEDLSKKEVILALHIASYYLELRQPTEAKVYLKNLRPYANFNDPELTADIVNQTALCLQQRTHALNSQKSYEEAKESAAETDAECRKIIDNYLLKGGKNKRKIAFAYHVLALSHYEKRLHSQDDKAISVVHLACQFSEIALKIYEENPSDALNTQFVDIKICYARFLEELRKYKKSLQTFEELMAYWNKYGDVAKDNYFYSKTILVYASFLFNYYNNIRKKELLIKAESLIETVRKLNHLKNTELREVNLLEYEISEALKKVENFEYNDFNLFRHKTCFDMSILKFSGFTRDKLTKESKLKLVDAIRDINNSFYIYRNNNLTKVLLLKHLATFSFFLARFKTALQYCSQANSFYLCTKLNDKKILLNLCRMQGEIFLCLGDYNNANLCLKSAMNLMEPNYGNKHTYLEPIDTYDTSVSYASLFILGLGNFNSEFKLKALNDLAIAMKFFQEDVRDCGKQDKAYLYRLAECHILSATYYIEKAAKEKNLDILDLAEDHLLKASEIYEKHFPKIMDKIRLYNKIGFCHLLRNDISAAQTYFETALTFSIEIEIPNHHLLETYLGLDKISEPCHDYKGKYYILADTLGIKIENIGEYKAYFDSLFSECNINANNSLAMQP